MLVTTFIYFNIFYLNFYRLTLIFYLNFNFSTIIITIILYCAMSNDTVGMVLYKKEILLLQCLDSTHVRMVVLNIFVTFQSQLFFAWSQAFTKLATKRKRTDSQR